MIITTKLDHGDGLCWDPSCVVCAAAPAPTKQPRDLAVERNRALLLQRSEVGLRKYGRPLSDLYLSRKQTLQHALEEALDLANYLQTEIMNIEAEENAKKDPSDRP